MEESNAPQGQIDTTDRSDNSQNNSTLANDLTATKKGPPTPAKGNCPHCHHREPPWWKRIGTWIEIAVFVVGVRVAYIYSGQLGAMLKANEIESRPYIGIEVRDKKMMFEPITKVEIVFHNSGKLPAYADLFWGLAYSKQRSYSPNVLAHNAREGVLSPWPVEYPIDNILAGDVPAQTPKAQAEAIEGMHSSVGFIYVWAEGRYGKTSDEAQAGKYDTVICTEYTISPGTPPTVERVAPCPWKDSNHAY